MQDEDNIKQGVTGVWVPAEVAFSSEWKNSEQKESMIREQDVWNFLRHDFLCVPFSFFGYFDKATIVWLSFMLSKQKYFENKEKLDREGYFYYGQKYLLQDCDISIDKQTAIIKNLESLNVIKTKTQGLPARKYYKIQLKVLLDYINTNDVPSSRKTQKLDSDPKPKLVPEHTRDILDSNILDHNRLDSNDSLLRNESVTKPAVLSVDSLFSSYSKQAKDLFEYFDSFCDILPRVLLKESNTFHKAMQDIENALSRGYKPDEIATAMTHYYNLVSNGTTKFKKTKGTTLVGLDGFFGWNKYIKDRAGEKSIIAKIKSWFDEALKGEEYLTKTYCMNNQYEHDILPEVTNVIRSNWMKSPYHAGELTVWDENNFRKATKMLVKWLDKRGDGYNFSSRYIEYPEEFVPKYLFPAIKNHLGKRDPKEITTNYLANQDMFERWLHVYLKKLGLYNRGDDFGRDGLYAPEN